MTQRKRIAALLLSAALLLQTSSITALAMEPLPEEADEISQSEPASTADALPAAVTVSGDFDGGFHWELDSEGVLAITGTGPMMDWEYDSKVPWKKNRNDITKVTISEGVTSIGNNAFYWCGNLKEIELPGDLARIGNFAFYQCGKLKLSKLPGTLKDIGENAFKGCENLNLTELPGGLSSIKNSAFANCNALTHLKLPDGITSIGTGAFNECKNLTEVELPSSLTHIYNDAFNGCGNLALAKVPDNLTYIGDGTFYNCKSLALTELPDSLNYIGTTAFYGCISLTELTLTKDPAPALGSPNPWGWGVFEECDNLKIYVPQTAADYDAPHNWPEDKIVRYALHSIEVQSTDGGVASASHTKRREGKQVTLTAAPANGYHFVKWEAPSSVQIENDNTFIMPASDVTVKAIFEKSTYIVKVESDGNGKFEDRHIGYTDSPKQEFVIENTGTQPITGLKVNLSDDTNFTLSADNVTDTLDVKKSETFRIQPKPALTAGTYAAEVNVTGDNNVNTTVSLSFEVTSHVFGNWTSKEDGTHTGTCKDCPEVQEEVCNKPKCSKCSYQWIAISALPNLTVKEGESATFTADATGSKIASWKWQQSTDGGESWADISGATGKSYAIPATTMGMDGWQYRVMVSNSGDMATSNPATLTVQKPATTVAPDDTARYKADKENPATSDNINTVVWAGLFLGSVIILAVLLVLHRRKGGKSSFLS